MLRAETSVHCVCFALYFNIDTPPLQQFKSCTQDLKNEEPKIIITSFLFSSTRLK